MTASWLFAKQIEFLEITAQIARGHSDFNNASLVLFYNLLAIRDSEWLDRASHTALWGGATAARLRVDVDVFSWLHQARAVVVVPPDYDNILRGLDNRSLFRRILDFLRFSECRATLFDLFIHLDLAIATLRLGRSLRDSNPLHARGSGSCELELIFTCLVGCRFATRKLQTRIATVKFHIKVVCCVTYLVE